MKLRVFSHLQALLVFLAQSSVGYSSQFAVTSGQTPYLTQQNVESRNVAGPSSQLQYVQQSAEAPPLVAQQPAPLSGQGSTTCPCLAQGEVAQASSNAGEVAQASSNANQCQVSKIVVREDHRSSTNGGMSFSDVTSLYGGSSISEAQRGMVALAEVATTSFMCLDDRVNIPSLVTPGGDLGEFILAFESYLQERDSTGESQPTQELVDSFLLKYLEALPPSRPMVHCTDERAISHLEADLPLENLNLQSPPEQAKQSGLLDRLAEPENHGDSHIRLMLKQPEWFQLHREVVPLVIKSYYSLLWKQNQDTSSSLHQSPKLKLIVLSGESNPQAFFEVTSSELCSGKGVAPMLTPRQGGRSVLMSHLDAVSLRRWEMANFFSRIANATPRKVSRDRLHQRIDRHGWLALETTGSRVAVGLPFYTLSYS